MSPPSTPPRPSAPTVGRGRKRLGRCCLRRSSILLCFLHGWLKIRDRAKHLKEVFAEVSRRVWNAYHAPDRRSLAQRLRRLRQWASRTPHRDGPGETSWTCVASRAMFDGIPPPRRPPYEQHARPSDARDEPLLRSGPTPARLAGGLPIALSCMGLVVQLHALAPERSARAKPRLAVPRRTT